MVDDQGDPIVDPTMPGGTTISGNPSSDPVVPTAMPTAMPTATAGPTTMPPVLDLENAPPLPLVFRGDPRYARAIRLTHDQWENSVRHILRIDETGEQQNLANDLGALYDFSNHEELLFVNANLYRDYQMAAEELAAMIGMDPAALTDIYPGEDAQGFIETVGRRAYRRPLTAVEIETLQIVYDEGAALTENGSTPHARGAALVLQALLQSPNFLYRLELAEPQARLSGFELAAKLSLLLLDVTPDDALLDMAANGQLDTDDGVRSVVSGMLQDDATALTLQKFHGELFKFNRYLSITKDAATVPEYTPALNEELQQAAYLFFDRIFAQDLGLAEVLTSTTGYVGPNMAPLYGVPSPGGEFAEVDLGPDRPGFFTHLPFLVLNAVNLTPDSIHRGVAINSEVLCGEIPPPPDGNVTLTPAVDGQTNRERITATSGLGTCGQSCHAPYINPLGFAFENFDGLGRLRDTDNGHPVDTTSAYPFTEGRKEFSGASQLMQIMAEGEQAHACYTKHLATFALQRDLTDEDKPVVNALAAESRAGASLKDLITAIVTNPTFTMRAIGGTP